MPPRTEIDPVCGMPVEETSTAPRTTYEGQPYFFCSPHCLEQFEAALAAKGFQMTTEEKSAVESLCGGVPGWSGGPTWAANTNGTADVWAAGLNIYFAAHTDPTTAGAKTG